MKTYDMTSTDDRNEYESEISILFQSKIKAAGGAQSVAFNMDTFITWMVNAPVATDTGVAHKIALQVFEDLNDRSERIYAMECNNNYFSLLTVVTWKSAGRYQSCVRTNNGQMSGILYGTSESDAYLVAIGYAHDNFLNNTKGSLNIAV